MSTKKTTSQKGFSPLYNEEKDLMETIERGEWQPVSEQKKSELMDVFSQAKIKGATKTKPISLRLKEATILSLKNKSISSGVPYQTIISALADQYAAGKIKLGI